MSESTNPFIGLTYAESLALLAARHGDREALVFGDARYSFRDLDRESRAVADRFHALGLRPGDKVAMWLTNRADYVFFWLGAARSGLVVSMMNTRLKRDEIAYQVRQSDSRAWIVPGPGEFRDFLEDVAGLCPEIRTMPAASLRCEAFPELRWVVCADTPPASLPGVTEWAKVQAAPGQHAPDARDPDAPALLSYSSGTTALPKGALITHCIWRKAWDMSERIDMTGEDCLYLTIPMFGSMATMNGFLQFWVRGGRVVLDTHFDAERALAAIHKERCTIAHLLPVMVQRMCAHPRRADYDLRSMRVAFVLSIDVGILSAAEDDLGIPGVLTGYGMTETSTVVCRNRPDDPRDVRYRTQGVPLPGLEIRIADPVTGADLPPDTPGEIQVRGYAITPGYYKKDAEYAKTQGPDGWFRTGDKGIITPEGRVSFISRLGDDYKSRGFNVSPSEIEAVLLTHPGVREAAVVGIPHPTHGFVGAAFVVASPATPSTEAELVAYMAERLASYKVPARVCYVDEFPLTEGTGKVQKFKLRERLLAGAQ